MLNRPAPRQRLRGSPADFERQSHLRQAGLVTEFFQFLLHSKKWWLAPIVVVLLILGFLVLLAGSPLAPWIYTVF